MTDSSIQANQPVATEQDSGFVLIAVVVTLIPLVLIAGAATNFLVANAGRMKQRITTAKAFYAAESGIDLAIFRLNLSLLGTGFVEDLGGGAKCTITVVDLSTDGVDNDNDSSTDEADEQVMQVRSVGEFRGMRRTLIAYLGVEWANIGIIGAVGLQTNPEPRLEGDLTPQVSGLNHNPDGTLGDPTFDLLGISTPASELATLISEISAGEAPYVTGTGGSPSVGTGPLDIIALIEEYRTLATRTLSNTDYEDVQWGDASIGNYEITYSGHELEVEGTSSGAGILIVDGDFKAKDSFRWTGVIIASGKFDLKKDSVVIGAVLSIGKHFHIKDTSAVLYSKSVVDAINTEFGSPRVVLYNGWQRVIND